MQHVEFEAQSDKGEELIKITGPEFGVKEIHFRETSGGGIKPVSGKAQRLVRKAISMRSTTTKPSVTLVHKGSIMKFTEGAFRDRNMSSRPSSAPRRSTAARGSRLKNPRTGERNHHQDSIADALCSRSCCAGRSTA